MSSRRRYYQYEQLFKGVANHRRIEILFILSKSPGLSTEDLVDRLKINYQTGAHHVQKIVRSGHVNAYREGNRVLHELSPLGKSIIKLLII